MQNVYIVGVIKRNFFNGTLAEPVQVDAVRAARLRRLDVPTTNGGEIPLPPIPEGGGENS